jgi:hypothetical protein
MEKKLNEMLPVVADSWARLRGCDVDRLLSCIEFKDVKSIQEAGSIIVAKRKDLEDYVCEAVAYYIEDFTSNE